VLNFFYGYDYRNDPSSEVPGAAALTGLAAPAQKSSRVLAYPNPLSEWCVISYDLAAGYKKLEITVTDQLGKTMYYSAAAGNASGNFVLDTREWPGGVYIYQVTTDGTTLKADKLIVAH
jgi:hypothetical protein